MANETETVLTGNIFQPFFLARVAKQMQGCAVFFVGFWFALWWRDVF
jgi:hypothetical protein